MDYCFLFCEWYRLNRSVPLVNFILIDLQFVQRVFNLFETFCSYMCIYLGCFSAWVPQQTLNISYVCTRFQQMSCKTVSQGMRRYMFCYFRIVKCCSQSFFILVSEYDPWSNPSNNHSRGWYCFTKILNTPSVLSR